MDWKQNKKMIRKSSYSLGAFACCFGLGIMGALFVYFSGIFDVNTMDELKAVLSENGIMVIAGSFFFFVFLFCIFSFILDFLFPAKKDIVYLSEDVLDNKHFVTKKGKRIFFSDPENKYLSGKYYEVIKSSNYIFEVLGETVESWDVKEKRSYWMNFYSPVGNFEDIFLLPIVYVILFIGVLSIFLAEGYEKIFGIIFSILPSFLIIYDYIFKKKLDENPHLLIPVNPQNDINFSVSASSSSGGAVIDDLASNSTDIYHSHDHEIITKLNASYFNIYKLIVLIPVIAMGVFVLYLLFNITDETSFKVFLLFALAALSGIGVTIAKIIGRIDLVAFFNKLYIIIFSLFWFGFLIFWTYGAIKQFNSFYPLIMTIPFWVAGIFVIYTNLFKKK